MTVILVLFQPTVIVPKPAQRTRVDWNEFPEEEVKERIQAPRLRLQEWWPEKQVRYFKYFTLLWVDS